MVPTEIERRAQRAVRRVRLAVLPALLVAGSLPAQSPPWAPALDSLVRSELARTRTPGASIAVVVDGRVAYAAGYGTANIETGQRVTTETLFRVGSVTKMFAAATLAQLAHDRKLNLDAPIGGIVPELKGRVARVTTHQLLTHSAGWIDNAVAYGRMGESALGEVMREVSDTMFFTDAGRVISYSNPGYSMAGYVAEVAGKERVGTLVENTVLRPTGMSRATFRPLVALTYPTSMGHIPGQPAPTIVRPFTENTAQWAAGFLFSSAPELGRFASMLMNGGTIDGRAVLAPEAVRRMTTGYMSIPGRLEDSVRYAYGLTVFRRGGERMWQHGGSINGFDASVTMLPDRKFAVIILDNLSGSPLNGILEAAVRHATGVTLATLTPPPPRDATPAERAALVGRYAMGQVRVEIAEENGALVFKQSGQTSPLRLAGTDGLVITPVAGAAVRLAYILGSDGKAAFLHQSTRAIARQP